MGPPNREIERSNLPLSVQNQYFNDAVFNLRKLDNTASRYLGYPLHRYCCCHVMEQGKEEPAEQLKKAWPTIEGKRVRWVSYPSSFVENSNLKGRASIIYSWSLGGGHNVVQESFSKRLAERQMHIYKLAADEEVLYKFDALYSLTRGTYSTCDLVNGLRKNGYWRTLQFLDWMFSGEKPEEQLKKADEFYTTIQRAGSPEIAITCFDRVLGSIEKACHRAKIPVLSVATDFAPDFSDIQKPGDVENPHFIRSTMMPVNDVLIDGIRQILKPEQIQFGGLPVREAFLRRYSTEELDALRDEWNILPDAQVVVLLAGAEGTENSYTDLIVGHYRESLEPSQLSHIHLFVVVGKNENLKRRLETSFGDLDHPRMQLSILGWTEEAQMGELGAMAAQEKNGLRGAILSTKGGGGTLSEAVALGAPILVCDGNPISWEKKNIEFICRNQLGLKFDHESQLVGSLDYLLKRPYQPTIFYNKIDSIERSTHLVSTLLKTSLVSEAASKALI